MANRRVFITGLGVITPIGVGADALWAGLRRGTSAVSEVTRFDPTPFRSRIAAEVRDFHPTDHIETRRARRLDRFSQFSVAATRLALATIGLSRVVVAGDGLFPTLTVQRSPESVALSSPRRP